MNKSAPEKQAAAWQYLKFLAEPENAPRGRSHRLHPDPEVVGVSSRDAAVLAANPGFKVAYDQLLSGKDTTATAGSVIGENQGCATRCATNRTACS